MEGNASEHRSVPHTADLRIEAWAPTRNGCIKEAVLGAVESFVDISTVRPERVRRCKLIEKRDDDLLVAVLDEVIYLLDTEGGVPVDIELRDSADGGVDICFAMAEASTLPQLGAIPKAVSLNDIRLSQDRVGWRCLVTLDV